MSHGAKVLTDLVIDINPHILRSPFERGDHILQQIIFFEGAQKRTLCLERAKI